MIGRGCRIWLALALTLAACRPVPIDSPLAGQQRFLCCNLHLDYEMPSADPLVAALTPPPFGDSGNSYITTPPQLRFVHRLGSATDDNEIMSGFVRAGTRVEIVRVFHQRFDRVEIRLPDGQSITMVHRYGRDVESIDQFIGKWLVVENPSSALAQWPAAVRQNVEASKAEPGMTKGQVLMALGFPPPHKTPRLDGERWRYWKALLNTVDAVFEGDLLVRMED